MSQSPVSADHFLAALDAAVDRHAMLNHPFYQAWSEGRLNQDILGAYAQQYFAHVKAFPTYVSGTHSASDDLDLRRELLANLVEEEGGENNHPELWLRFAEGLGVSRDDVLGAELLEKTEASVNTFKALTRSGDPLKGLAALYAYESQIPEVATTKKAGLKAFYGIDGARTTDFFTVHEGADVVHREVERNALNRLATTDEARGLAVSAAEEAAKALWLFLDGVQEAYLDDMVC